MDDTDYPFNDEFLFTPADQENARALYGPIYPALDHPELRALFTPFDADSNAAKRRSRRWGIAAVLLVAAAFLLVTGAEAVPLDEHTKLVVAGFSAVLSASGAALGAFGVLSAASKKKWLVNRFVTERLRQFHFQTLVLLSPDIVEAAESGDWRVFVRKRTLALTAFREDVIKHRLSLFNALLGDDSEEGWLLPYAEAAPPDGPYTKLLFDAYRHMRIARQINFSDYKLQTTNRLFSPFPIDQASRFAGVAMTCVFALLLLHLATPVDMAFHKIVPSEALSFTAVAVAIIALAVRTLEEGLRPGREVERYRAYKSALKSIRNRFEASQTPEGKIKAAASLETLSYNEMVNFLKSNYEASFVM